MYVYFKNVMKDSMDRTVHSNVETVPPVLAPLLTVIVQTVVLKELHDYCVRNPSRRILLQVPLLGPLLEL